MQRAPRLTWLLVPVVIWAGCASSAKRVRDASESAHSWAATVKVVTEQWAQSRVSQRFTRTTLDTAITDLSREAEAIRSIDSTAAAHIDRLNDGIGEVMVAVAANQPDRARDAAAGLMSLAEPDPSTASDRPR